MTRRYTRTEFEQVFNHQFGELMPGAVPQGIEELSTTQRYKIGSRLQLGPKVYHYAYASSVCEALLGAFIYNCQDTTQRALPVGAPIGSWSVSINIDATDGPLHDGSMPLNYLVGGQVLFYTNVGGHTFQRGITGNTARVSDLAEGAITIYLDAPTNFELTVAADAQCQASPYANVCGDAFTYQNEYDVVAGVPAVALLAERYTWLQTWGPTTLAASAAVGLAKGDRAVYFVGNGSLGQGEAMGEAAVGLSITGQYAGYILSVFPGAPHQGAPFIMLQLDP